MTTRYKVTLVIEAQGDPVEADVEEALTECIDLEIAAHRVFRQIRRHGVRFLELTRVTVERDASW